MPVCSIFPHGQLLFPARGHSPQDPEWQPLSQQCFWQDSWRPQLFSHLKSNSAHARSAVVRPHLHGWTAVLAQGGHAPWWHDFSQLCFPQPKSFWHSFPHEKLRCPQRRISEAPPQKQLQRTEPCELKRTKPPVPSRDKAEAIFYESIYSESLNAQYKLQNSMTDWAEGIKEFKY